MCNLGVFDFMTHQNINIRTTCILTMATQKGELATVMEEPNLTDLDLSLKLTKTNNVSDDLADIKPHLTDLSNVESKLEVSTNDSSYIKPEPAKTNQDEDISRDLSQVIRQETQEHSLSACEMKIEIMYCRSCLHCDVDVDRLKIHIFRKHPNEAAVVTNTLNKVDCNINGIRLFCVRETCTFSSTFCNAYEEHLMSCCPLQQSLSDGEMERLRSTLEFLLDFHHRHRLNVVSGFVDYVTCLDTTVLCEEDKVKLQISTHLDNYCSSSISGGTSQSLNLTSIVDKTEVHGNTSLLVGEQERKQEQFTALDLCTNINLKSSSVGGTALDQSRINQNIVLENISLEIDVAGLPNDASPLKQMMEDDRIKGEISAMNGGNCFNDDLGVSNQQPGNNRYIRDECGKSLDFIDLHQWNDLSKSVHTGDKPFHCIEFECGETFNERGSLSKHKKRLHSRDKPVQCDECGKTLCDRSNLIRHKRIHTGDKQFKCDECDKTFRERSDLNFHKRIHSGNKPFQCTECDKTFYKRSMLNGHKRIHTGEKPFQCDECGRTFSHRCNLNSHKRIHTGDKPFQCDECDTIFSHRSQLNRHKRIHTGDKQFQCKECDITFSHSSHLNTHTRIHKGYRPFQCSECGKTFSQRGNLNRHKRIHTGDKPFQCNECDETFSERSNLNIHMSIHAGDKPFQYDECDKTFSERGNLNIHVRNHTGDKPFQCNECDKTFSLKNDLNIHMKIHTGDKPFQCIEYSETFNERGSLSKHKKRLYIRDKPVQCDECGKTLCDRSNLIRHKRIHTGDKRFKCDECDKTFRERSDLNFHKRIHSGNKPFQCNECDKTFYNNSMLNGHKRIHTGEKPFQCDECGRTFSHRCNFNTHKRIHTGEKPFQCNECDKTFSHRSHLNRHKRIHTETISV